MKKQNPTIINKIILVIALMFIGTSNVFAVSGEINLCDVQTNPGVIRALRIVGLCIAVVKIVVPIILIVVGMINLAKPIVAGDQDSLKKSLQAFSKQAIAAVLIFLVPSIVLTLFEQIDGFDSIESKYSTCVECILDVNSDACPQTCKYGEADCSS